MRRYAKPHHHPCADCGSKTPCDGLWEQNYDGFPEVICPEYHGTDGTLNPEFICEACEWAREDRVVAEAQRFA
jgi:hypothetical protein